MAGYELSRDADGNVILVPSTTPAAKPMGFWDDVTSKARNYFLPRASDFTEGTAAAYGAGRDISQRGYENFKTNPLYGAGQIIGGSALSAISPLAGATEYVTKPVGRTLGPAFEHAAEVASMFTPLPSKGASMFKLRPKAAPVSELANIPREFSYLPRDMQETINAMPPADRAQVFQVLREGGAGAPTAAARPAAPSAASEAVETARSISPVDLAIQQNRNPGRFVNPETGMPQSVRDPLTGQMRPAMGAIHDPFEALAQRVSEMPGPVDYLTRPRPVINPDTGYQLQSILPNGRFGPGRTEFTPGQRLAQGTAIGAPLVAAGVGLSNVMQPPSATAASGPRDMDRGNSLGVDELSAYPSGAVRRSLDRTNALGVDELSAYPAGAVHNYNRSNAPGVDELSAYPRSPVQLAKQRMAAAQATGERAPAPMRRPDEGMLSKIFNSPVSTRELYQRSQDNPEDSGAYMRAERQYAATHRDAPSFDLTKLNDQGMKRGGSANAKPDSVHKALEIIHHLLTRGH